MFRSKKEMKQRRRAKEAAKGPIDLATDKGRKRARNELVWGDHGFLRVNFQNLHQISDEMWRGNQPSPEQVEEHVRERGIKTIINLRGASPKGYYLLEKEACEANEVELVDFQVFSRDTPTREVFHGAKDLFERIAYPAFMHCKSGADRAGLMAVLYMHFRQGLPIAEAKEQLSLKYLHVKHGKTGVLDYVFERYLVETASSGMAFIDWVDQVYDRKAVKADFQASGRGNLRIDEVLGRE